MNRTTFSRLTIVIGAMGLIALACSDDNPAGPAGNPGFVTMSFVVEVTDVHDNDNLLGGVIKIGDNIQGTYTFDPSTPDMTASPNIGAYRHDEAPCGMTLEGGGLTFQTDPDDVYFLMEYNNDFLTPPYDVYLVRSYNNLSLNDTILVDHISFQLHDNTATAHDSDSLTTLPPVLANYNVNYGSIEGCDVNLNRDYCIEFTLTEIRRRFP